MALNFVVPMLLQKEYRALVQRANRRVKSNLNYITKHKIKSDKTRRSLVGSFDEHLKWAGGRTPFSSSTRGRYIWDADREQMVFREFRSAREFESYVRELEKYGAPGKDYARNPKKIKDKYKSSIIRGLNEVKDQYNITMPGGRIPDEVLDMLDDLTVEEITNFWGDGDPSEDVEVGQFDSDEFADVTNAEEFTDVVRARIGKLKKFH